jgi:CHASE2 domain-containing sensor protein
VQQAIITFWHRAIDRKNRVFIWASLLVLVLTLAEGLQPLDHLFRLSRSGLFLQDAKPKLAIVLVDNASINRFGEWPWERKDIANLVTAIDRAGAKRMAFEHVFVPNQDDAGTAALARAFDALPQRPIIAASYEIDRAGSERKLKWPDRQLSAHAQVAISSFPISYMGYLLTIENSVLVDGHELPSMAT